MSLPSFLRGGSPRPNPTETLRAIAARLDAHVKRLEVEGATVHPQSEYARGREGLPFKNAGARVAGARVVVTVTPYPSFLDREQAEAYLAALDAGFRGDVATFQQAEALREARGG